MDRVDAMKKLQGWTDTSVLHFRNLALFGEQILLSVRFRAWNDIDDGADATIWARWWRPAIQGYIYAYRAVSGVDLTADVTSPQDIALRNTQPSVLLSQRSPMDRRAGLVGCLTGRHERSRAAAIDRATLAQVTPSRLCSTLPLHST